MDREPESRRDLEHAQPGPNPMGGELFTVIETIYGTNWQGKRVAIARTEKRRVPFGAYFPHTS